MECGGAAAFAALCVVSDGWVEAYVVGAVAAAFQIDDECLIRGDELA